MIWHGRYQPLTNMKPCKDETSWFSPHMPSPTELPAFPPLHFRMGYRGTLKNLKIGGDEESKWIFCAVRRIQAVLRRDAICIPGMSNE